MAANFFRNQPRSIATRLRNSTQAEETKKIFYFFDNGVLKSRGRHHPDKRRIWRVLVKLGARLNRQPFFYPITASQWVYVPHFSLPNVTFKNGQNFRSFIWFFSNHTVFSYNSPVFKAIFSDIRDIFLTIRENPFFQKSLDNLHSSCYNQATRHAVTHDLAKEGYYAKQVSKRKYANKKAYR